MTDYEWVLAISLAGHDANITLLHHGEIVLYLNEERIKKWNSDNLNELPIYEPGLAEIIKTCRGRNLYFSNAIEEKIANADVVFISVNTPTKEKGLGAGKASNLKWV